MRFASLGSGSKGNSTLIETQDTCVMVDCGFGVRDVCRRLLALGKTPEDLSAILVTHEHSDHWKGVVPLARKFSIPIFLTAGCLKSRDRVYEGVNFNIIDSHIPFAIGDLHVTPVPVPHDAREPVQYVFDAHGIKFGILTDIGHSTPFVEGQYSNCHGLLLEANYDQDMLDSGPYPSFLKERVGGKFGHLSNDQLSAFLLKIDQRNLKVILIGHVSEKNNHIDKVKLAIADSLSARDPLEYASQEAGSPWIELNG
ncbi:MAG: MBL fold metallo-hydrolase [Proteobacteria bacterium]|nr:MBL fold metallo-hydrolase [Pseudomonadota bacterium]MDA1351846.1 MBL fold metallo-hydrolase [Pseudomonadota bacterium]